MTTPIKILTATARELTRRLLLLATAALGVAACAHSPHTQQSTAIDDCARVVSGDSTVSGAFARLVYDSGAPCIPVWTDALRSAVPARVILAAQALSMTGDSAAVRALRAEYTRAPTRPVLHALIDAIGTTDIDADIAFLTKQLASPDWSTVYEAVNTLGLLRATSARPAIEDLLRRFPPSTFVNRGAAAALAVLDHAPCTAADSGDVEQTLKLIVMRCEPQALGKSGRYWDSKENGVWEYGAGGWQLNPTAVADPKMPKLTLSVIVASGGRNAEVFLSMYCGMLCAEGWSYRLIKRDSIWRVVTATLQTVS